MAEYVQFEKNIEANGSAAMIFILSGAIGKESRKALLKKHGITEDIKPDAWYDLQSILNAYKELAENIGEMNLFLVGKAVMEQAEFPPMDGLESALKSIDVAYHMNHRKNGQVMFDPNNGSMIEGIGHYTLTKYDAEKKEAEMECHTPYPSKFEEGLITQIVRRFKPAGSLRGRVTLDDSKETRKRGGDRCTFKIQW